MGEGSSLKDAEVACAEGPGKIGGELLAGELPLGTAACAEGPGESGGELPLGELPLGAAPSTQSIVAWATARILLRDKLSMVEPGRLFYCGVPRDMDQRIHDMLQPVFSHINRDDHCERYGFLHIARAMVRRCGYDGTDDCSGVVTMYVSHFPCISCIAVFCQFIRFFPGVRLEMDFDNMWKTRFFHNRENCRPDAWKVFDVLEGAAGEAPAA